MRHTAEAHITYTGPVHINGYHTQYFILYKPILKFGHLRLESLRYNSISILNQSLLGSRTPCSFQTKKSRPTYSFEHYQLILRTQMRRKLNHQIAREQKCNQNIISKRVSDCHVYTIFVVPLNQRVQWYKHATASFAHCGET